MPVAFEIAAALSAPLDVIVVRKLGHPQRPELAMGALGEGGTRVLNPEVLREERVGADELANIERTPRPSWTDRSLGCGAVAWRYASRIGSRSSWTTV